MKIYLKILGEEAGELLKSILSPLRKAIEQSSLQNKSAAELDANLSRLLRLAVEIWCNSNIDEAPTHNWLYNYLKEDLPAGLYKAVVPADLIWSVYSFFTW